MLCFPNAKINIGLNIVQKRSDGYHNIETVFCPVDLSDILELVPLPGLPAGNYSFSQTGLPLEGTVHDNLCVKAYRLLLRDFNLPAVDIHLHKMIPVGAGLGGGSSDAAFMLKHLNRQFDLNLSEERLIDYASALGSDCAFFIRNKPLFGYDRGNRFRDIPVFPDNLEVTLVFPGIHISTADAYSGVRPKKPLRPLEELIIRPVEQWRGNINNDFETTLFASFPVLGIIKDRLYQHGAVYASMSGSGSSVYGLFRQSPPDIQEVFQDYFCWTGPLSAAI